jgi:hypothetical protein
MTEVYEHTVDLALLPDNSKILDHGCRGFQFTNYMRSLDLGYKVYPVDIDKLEGQAYHQCAITNFNGRCGVLRGSDPQGTRIKQGDEINAYTLTRFSELLDVDWWDLVKMDVEGAEMEIILSLEEPIATQISVEFHLHTGIYTQKEMIEVEGKLRTLGYEFAQHELTEQHGAGYNYWNSLFILK